MPKKTIPNWLNRLPEGYAELAVNNYRNNPDKKKISGDKVEHMSSALVDAFRWSKTPEGYSFWNELFDYYCATEDHPMPKLPETKKATK